MKFKLIDKCFQDASNVAGNGADFLIEDNEWDDYGYHVMYHLHATDKLTKRGNVYLGYIRIMKRGQDEGEIYLLEKDLNGRKVFEHLPDDYVSLTLSVDVFKGLSKYLRPEERPTFIEALHLILGEDSPYYQEVKEEGCFVNGLLRDATIDNYSLKKGRALIEDGAVHYNLQEQDVTIQFAHVDNSITLNFSCLPDISSRFIPNGVVAFIGKNGSGKSTAIYNLAKLIYANPDRRFLLKEKVGKISPNDMGISKLFLISYSPFDNFVLPGIGGEDYRLILNGMENNDGRFIFCGIRDIKKEFESLLENPDEQTYDRLFENERLDATQLKPIKMLAKECATAMDAIEREETKLNLWKKIAKRSKAEFPEIRETMMGLYSCLSRRERIELFLSQSTGYKFFLHSLAHIIAYIDDDCLILFDEPENHIHPPMLSFMMATLREILPQYQSVMLVATHSPVVIQETFANNVFVVRNHGDLSTISHPSIETYGANIAEITSEVFDLTTDITKYYNAFDDMYERWNEEEQWESIDEMLASFERHLSGKITSQIISYLVGKFADEYPESIQ